VAYGAGARHFDNTAALIAALNEAPRAKNILVKGSRFMQMEKVVAALLAEDHQGGANHAA
jgi:UDP-N-acetylmuramoyl-tripeptide--D-alanyl-D-alanine ligase